MQKGEASGHLALLTSNFGLTRCWLDRQLLLFRLTLDERLPHGREQIRAFLRSGCSVRGETFARVRCESGSEFALGEEKEITHAAKYLVIVSAADIFDAKINQAIWHGFACDALSGNARSNTQATEQAVDKMFNNFPPESQPIDSRY